jgi:hypothetical protein
MVGGSGGGFQVAKNDETTGCVVMLLITKFDIKEWTGSPGNP